MVDSYLLDRDGGMESTADDLVVGHSFEYPLGLIQEDGQAPYMFGQSWAM